MLPKILTSLLVFGCVFSFAQTQLTDFNYSDQLDYSSPREFFEFNNQLYFIAQNDKTGSELWKTDGTAAGCSLVKDINLGNGSSIISNFLRFKNKFYFIATDGIYGYQLWASDGTSPGTKKITSGVTYPVQKLVATNDHIFFLTKNNKKLEVWKSDGTAEGTTVVKGDIPIWNNPENLTVAMGKVFFSAQPEGSNNTRVWRTDGTYDGTIPITQILDGNGSGPGGTSHPTQFVEFNGALYFVSRGNPFTYPNTVGIMKTDGTVEGTVPVRGIHPGSMRLIEYSDVMVHNGKMYFSFFEVDYNRYFIWSSEGTAGSTTLEYDYSGPDYFSPCEMSVMDDKIYFTAGNSSGGTSLIQFNPSTKAAQEVKEVFSRQEAPFIFFSFIDANKIISSGNKIFLAVSTGTYYSFDLWLSDGSIAGTSKAPGIQTGDFSIFKNQLFFNGKNGKDMELYKSDGTVAGTDLLKDLNPSSRGLAWSSPLYEINNKALFNNYDSLHGHELWQTDGTKSGTQLLLDILPGKYSSSPYDFINAENKLFFSASPDNESREIFVSDGTSGGTKAITNLKASKQTVNRLIPLKETVFFFTTRKPDNSTSIYKCDATTESVVEVYNFGLNEYGVGFYLTHFASIDNILYFVIEAAGNDLWKTDGTSDGTVKIGDFYEISELTTAGEQVFFIEKTDFFSGDTYLQKTDGTPGGTVSLKKLNPNLTERSLFSYNNKVVFVDQDETYGREIWISDGSIEKTSVLKDVYEGSSSSLETTEFKVHDNNLYFIASSAEKGSELWKSNGITEGTNIVSDILPGADHSKPYSLVSTGGRLYFTAFTPQHGFEIWSTGADPKDTRLELDVIPGETYSNPNGYLYLNDKLLFYATTLSSGLQLWSYSQITASESLAENRIEVYPNPSNGLFMLSNHEMAGTSLVVFNASGNCIYTEPSLSELSQVNLETFPSGLYVFQFKKGNTKYTRKVMKI